MGMGKSLWCMREASRLRDSNVPLLAKRGNLYSSAILLGSGDVCPEYFALFFL